jgi:hypothetical protein
LSSSFLKISLSVKQIRLWEAVARLPHGSPLNVNGGVSDGDVYLVAVGGQLFGYGFVDFHPYFMEEDVHGTATDNVSLSHFGADDGFDDVESGASLHGITFFLFVLSLKDVFSIPWNEGAVNPFLQALRIFFYPFTVGRKEQDSSPHKDQPCKCSFHKHSPTKETKHAGQDTERATQVSKETIESLHGDTSLMSILYISIVF